MSYETPSRHLDPGLADSIHLHLLHWGNQSRLELGHFISRFRVIWQREKGGPKSFSGSVAVADHGPSQRLELVSPISQM
jgi:hypothetical protein